jgi:hypothetical protein
VEIEAVKIKKIKKRNKQSKYKLLDEVEYSRKNHVENLSFRLLIGVFLVLFTALIIILPKIYLKNEIYYKSRDISKLYNEYSILKEENRVLKQKLEYIKFKNQVLDTMF